MVHPSFPGGRSGALRDGPSSKDSDGAIDAAFEWDVRFVAGLGADPDARAPNPEYFELEGLRDDAQRRALPEDASLAAELAAAAAAAAAKAREGEVRDALYLSVVHKFNACGVPLVVDPGDYGANALPSVRPSRHLRGADARRGYGLGEGSRSARSRGERRSAGSGSRRQGSTATRPATTS